MIVGVIWITVAISLLAIALSIYDKLGEKLSNEATMLFLIIASFWPLFLIFVVVLTTFDSYNARQLFRRTFK